MSNHRTRRIKLRSAEDILARLSSSATPQSFDELMELLDHEVWTVRKRAAAILALQGPTMVDRIKERFLTLSENQRYWSIRVIARILGPGSLGWLKQLFRSPNASVRGSVISAAGEIPGDEAIDFLFASLADDAWPNRYAAAEQLERRGRQIVPFLAKGISEGPGDSKYWSLRLLVRVLREEGLSLLGQCLEAADQTLRYYAVRAVGESDEPWALEILTKALGDASWTNRQMASHILKGKGKLAVTPVCEALRAGDHDVIFWALRTLSEIGDDRSVTAIAQVSARTDLDPEAKEWVVAALAGIRTESSAKRLFEVAVDEEATRVFALEKLTGFGTLVVRPLLRYVRSTNPQARSLATTVLRGLTLPGLERLVVEFESAAPARSELVVQGLKTYDQKALDEMFRKGTATLARFEEAAGRATIGDASRASTGDAGRAGGEASDAAVKSSPKVQSVADGSYPVTFDRMLTRALEEGASDIHLRVGHPPVFRLQGVLTPTELPVLADAQIEKLLNQVVTPLQMKSFRKEKELDFGHEIPGLSRFRVNVFSEILGLGVVARVIPSAVPSLTDLCLPPVFGQICAHIDGLVLVTGPTGSGKSTTLAAMIDYINETRDEHILTIEDPVEFRQAKKRCLISYRELGRNTRSFSRALRAALREDPDVILVGELRDRQTIALAIRAAETGHLVLGTLHTSSAAETVDRIINVFPGSQQANIRMALSTCLRAVICQHLVPSVDRKRTAALEILLVNFAVANMIREQKLNQIESAIMAGRKEGMTTRDEHLSLLVKQRRITPDVAHEYSCNKQEMEKLLKRL